jgi:hypothetical protein
MADQVEARVLLSDLIVTTTGDSANDPATLRFALLQQQTSGDRIVFQIPASDPNYNAATGSWKIPISSPLPPVKGDIDGLSQQTQPGASTTHPVIQITPAAGFPADGLAVDASKLTVSGLVIDGFQGNGIIVLPENVTDTIVGNYIGTDVTGTAAVPNGLAGVRIEGLASTIKNNVISGNGQDGVLIFGNDADENQVVSNFIGTDATGVAALGNGGNGVFVDAGLFNLIGGAAAPQGNIIANNVQNGVRVDTGVGNAVLSNSIFNNAAGGIALTGGGNNNQAAPVLTSALVFPGRTTVDGTLAVKANIGYLVQYFENNPAAGQGRTLIGSQAIGALAADGTFLLVFTTTALPADSTITAIASVTSTPPESENPATGDTSPFSNAVVVFNPFIVTNTADTGRGSLRFAVDSANADVNNDDTITFRIPQADPGFNPATGSWTILVQSPLAITKLASEGGQRGVIIDGLSQQSQPGAASTHPVILLTSGPRYAGDGLTINSSGNRVDGLVLSGFRADGILINPGANNNLLESDFLGTDVTGSAAMGNGLAGLRIRGAANTIFQNVISGNAKEGVFIVGGGNTILGSFIGTNAAGSAALGNGLSGITVQQSAGNTIAGNVLSGNGLLPVGGSGIVLVGPGGDRNLVVANRIGTDAAGVRALPNSGEGVLVSGSSNTIGGTAVGAGNLISGNGNHGVAISGASNNMVLGNEIGVAAGGATALGNVLDGIFLDDASGTTISGNLISGNGVGQDAAGINITGADARNNVMSNNRIGTNAAGTAGVGNSLHGIFIGDGASNNVVGPGNLISANGTSANQGVGVYVFGATSTGNQVIGNRIGTDINGTSRLDVSVIGVLISQAPGNSVRVNLISGNRFIGLEIAGGTASGNLVQANSIGTNAAGTRAIPNRFDGIFINDAPNNTIGGTTAGAGNLISGNGSAGIQLFGPLTRGNVIQGNSLGLDSAGRLTLPNRAVGIFVNTNASANTIGGTGPGQSNRGQVRPQFVLQSGVQASQGGGAAAFRTGHRRHNARSTGKHHSLALHKRQPGLFGHRPWFKVTARKASARPAGLRF